MNSRRAVAGVPAARPDAAATATIATAILDFIGEVPRSEERSRDTPGEAARKRAAIAGAKAAAAAGTLALPPGPLGWVTIVPEMVAVWKIQAAMVADIAAYYGKSGALTREHMLFCLFRHTASQAVRDLVVRSGERFLIKRATVTVLQAVAKRIGVKLSQRTITRAASRWLPIVGALGVAGYAYYDTTQVANAAIELFGREIEVETLEAEG